MISYQAQHEQFLGGQYTDHGDSLNSLANADLPDPEPVLLALGHLIVSDWAAAGGHFRISQYGDNVYVGYDNCSKMIYVFDPRTARFEDVYVGFAARPEVDYSYDPSPSLIAATGKAEWSEDDSEILRELA